jgi:hypothetical protein
MTVIDRPPETHGLGPEPPEVLFPEARQRRRRRWLFGGVVVGVAVVVAVGLLVGVFRGRSNGVPSLSPAAERLISAFRTTEAAGTAAFTSTSQVLAPPIARTVSGGVETGFIRFRGAEEESVLPGEPLNFLFYCFGQTAYLPSGPPGDPATWRTQYNGSSCNPLQPLESWVRAGTPVTDLGSQETNGQRTTEYLVLQPAIRSMRSSPAKMYVSVDSEGRIFRTDVPHVFVSYPPAAGLPGGTFRIWHNELNLGQFGVSFHPTVPVPTVPAAHSRT